MAGNMKTLAIVLIVALVAGLAATGGWAIYEGVKLYKRKQAHKKAAGPPKIKGLHLGGGPQQVPIGNSIVNLGPQQAPVSTAGAYAPGPSTQTNRSSYALDPLGAGRMRSNRATGYDTDLSNSCLNENLVGAIQAPLSDRAGNMRPSFPSAPMGGKPVPLGSSKISNNSRKHGSLGRTSSVDLSGFARMGLDRAIGAQGLDDPAELALASVMLGHIEAAGNTRYDSTDPRGEAVGSWQVGYSTTASGIVEPGAGGSIPTQGPYQMAIRPTGMPY